MRMLMKQRAAAGMMTGAAALAIAGFTALGSIFNYPQILKATTPEILDSYRESQIAITGWFLALVISAGLLAPIGVLLGRITGGILGKWITGVGIAAATVQVIGLSRWVLLIPGISDDATVPALTENAHRTFEQLHFWLGTILGETVGMPSPRPSLSWSSLPSPAMPRSPAQSPPGGSATSGTSQPP